MHCWGPHHRQEPVAGKGSGPGRTWVLGRSMAAGQGPGPRAQPRPQPGVGSSPPVSYALWEGPAITCSHAAARDSSGLLHRTWVTGGGDARTPGCLHSLVCGLTQLLFLSGPVVTISGGPVGGAPPVSSSSWGVSLYGPGPFALRLLRSCGGHATAGPRVMPEAGGPTGGPRTSDQGRADTGSQSPLLPGPLLGLLWVPRLCPSVRGQEWSVCE